MRSVFFSLAAEKNNSYLSEMRTNFFSQQRLEPFWIVFYFALLFYCTCSTEISTILFYFILYLSLQSTSLSLFEMRHRDEKKIFIYLFLYLSLQSTSLFEIKNK
jgi:hypothetical protein